MSHDLAFAADADAPLRQPAPQETGSSQPRPESAARRAVPALTIVHVAGFPTGLRLRAHHSVELKLSNGLIRLGHLVLNFSDRDVARGKSLTGSSYFGRAAVNRALLDFCAHHRPDVLLLGHAALIMPATILAIRARLPRLRVGQWNVDPLFTPANVAEFKRYLPVVDASFVTTAGAPLAALRAGGHAISFMPNPADASIERGRADLQAELPFDLFYACGNPARPPRHVCGEAWHMDDFFKMLAARLPQLRLQLAGVFGQPAVKAAAYQAALEQSALGLNISRRADHPLYSSDRIAQLAANGCLVAIERGVGYDRYFGDDAMLFFDSVDELVERLRELTAQPQQRMRMAARGRAIYLEKFNERRVAAHLLSVLWGDTDPEAMPW